MAVPVVLLILSGAAAAGGAGAGAYGGVKVSEANKILDAAHVRHDRNLRCFNEQYDKTMRMLDTLGRLELQILKSFSDFQDAVAKIQGRPDFATLDLRGMPLPKCDLTELEQASTGANVLLGGLSGAALGTAGAFAASSATNAAVVAFGTASTGVEIASLSGAAATNATLAALGGGSLAAGGGGMALGTIVLSAASTGVGVLIGGIIFGVVGSSMANKACSTWNEMKRAETEMEDASKYLRQLSEIASNYGRTMERAQKIYAEHLRQLVAITARNTEWATYTDRERLIVGNTVLLVRLLFSMCKVRLVDKVSNTTKSVGRINLAEARGQADQAQQLLATLPEA